MTSRPAISRLQAVAVAALLVSLTATGCSEDGDPVRDAVDQDAAGLVATGEVDGDPVEGVPAERAERLAVLLTEVDWKGAQTTRLADGLLAAAADDDTLVSDLVEGVGGSAEDVHAALRPAVGRLLVDHADAVFAAYGAPLDAEPSLDRADLDRVLAQVGQDEDAFADLQQQAVDTIRDGVPPELDAVPAADWAEAMARTADQWTTPIGTVLGTVLRATCSDDRSACDERIRQAGDLVGRQLQGAAYGAIPVSMLPDSLLLASGERARPLTENSAGYVDWQRIAGRYPALDIVPSIEAAAAV